MISPTSSIIHAIDTAATVLVPFYNDFSHKLILRSNDPTTAAPTAAGSNKYIRGNTPDSGSIFADTESITLMDGNIGLVPKDRSRQMKLFVTYYDVELENERGRVAM